MSAPRQIWWNAKELAYARLPGLPGSPRGIDKHAKTRGWRNRHGLARRRSALGGGWEYHWTLLPDAARRRLLADAPAEDAPETKDRQGFWDAFESLPDRAKETARARLRALDEAERLAATGITLKLAVAQVARAQAIGASTIWRWLSLVEGVAQEDRLAYLAPRHGRAASRTTGAVDPRFFDQLKGDFLRLAQPSFTASYRRTERVAKAKGWPVPGERLARRHLDREVPKSVQIYARQGWTGLQRHFPPQIRDRRDMVALQHLNADCHRWDVFVRWPGHDTPVRPHVIAFQDTYSGKILSWRIDLTPNKVAVMEAFGEVVETYGLPQECLFDNGMEFANKWLTGGAQHRFRFKLRDDEALGVLEQLGIKMHFATPGHGQAKPIERAFRDFADDIAKDPRFEGAYTGNSPTAKPENYGNSAVPLDLFLQVVEEGIAAHNAREGRRGQTAQGRSFDRVFAESYATAPVRKATEAQRRLWLMGQETRKLDKKTGAVTLFKNAYYSPWMLPHAGEEVVVRFAPENLHGAVYIYAKDGRYLGEAACRAPVGFRDMASARDDGRETAQIKRAHKRYLDAIRPKAGDVAAHLDAARPEAGDDPEARVVRPAFGTRKGAPAVPGQAPALDREAAAAEAVELQAFKARKRAKTPALPTKHDPYVDAKWALRVEAALRGGEAVGDAEKERLRAIQETPEYRAFSRLQKHAGDAKPAG